MPTYNGDDGDNVINGSSLSDTINGNGGNDTLNGDAGNDTIDGGDGDDTIDGGAGNDTINGGNGDDTAYVTGGTTSADTGTEIVDLGYATPDGEPNTGGETGRDHLIVDYSAIIQNVIFHGTSQSDVGPEFGSTGARAVADIGGVQRLSFAGVGVLTVSTGSGNDRIYGVGTKDVISSGAGDDTIYVYSQGLFASQYSRIDGGEGIDVVYSLRWHDLNTAVVLDANDPSGVTIGSGEDQRFLRGVESLYGFTTGNGDDLITLHRSGALQNVIDTGGGADTVTVFGGSTAATTAYTNIDLGFGGPDHLIVDFSGATEQVVYLGNSGAGGSTSIGGVQHHVYWNLEKVTVTGGSEDDIFDGRDAAFDPQQAFFGGAGSDSLYGGWGNDTLDGGAGDDVLDGGNGSDTASYATAASGVTVKLALGGSQDTVGAGVDTLNSIENANGSVWNDTLIGNAGANVLRGGGGRDYLIGLGGGDVLVGNADAASTLQGGTGNDTYHIYNSGDSVIEYTGEGTDRIYASVNYVLGADRAVEQIFSADQAATTPLNLTGNALGQAILGNAGANVLTGGGGTDTLLGMGGDDFLFGNADAASQLQGGTGDDWYYVSRTGDSLVELAGEGFDRILSSVSYVLGPGREVEMLSTRDLSATTALNLTGNEFGQTVLGNEGANTLSGGGGNDVIAGFGGNDILLGGDGDDQLNGGAGYDVLNGGAGADRFVFADAFGPAFADRIQDFVSGLDRIFLENDLFTGLPNGALAANAFRTGSAALDADDRIIYNPASGALLFDADGNGAGAAVQFAVLSGAPALAASDFVVI